jgi:hypothetical protein
MFGFHQFVMGSLICLVCLVGPNAVAEAGVSCSPEQSQCVSDCFNKFKKTNQTKARQACLKECNKKYPC